METLSAHRQNGPRSQKDCDSSVALLPVRETQRISVAVPLYPDVLAGILGDLLVGQNLLGRAIFEAERACATLGALFPSRQLCVLET